MQSIENLLDIFVSLFGAFLMAALIRPAVKDKWIPAVFAYVLFWSGAGMVFMPFFGIWIYRFLGVVYIFSLGFLLGCLRVRYFSRNGAWWGFSLFIGWFCLAGYQSDGTIGETTLVAYKLLRMVVIGYVVGAWAISTPDGFHRLIKAVTIGACAASLLYLMKSSWSMSSFDDMGGRMVVDTTNMVGDQGFIAGTFNVNRFALLTSMLLPYPFLMVMCNWRDRRDKWYRVAALFSCLVLTMVLFRTGSRNGGIALIALGWFFVVSRTGVRLPKKILIAIVVFLAMVIAVSRYIGKHDLRVFQFLQEDEKYEFSRLGNSRGEMAINIYSSMTPMQRVFGSGVPWQTLSDSVTGVALGKSVGNSHSVYLQIFRQSGYVGVVLFLLFCLIFFVSAHRCVRTRQVAILFFLIFVLTGIGEAANITESSGYAKYGLGIALAFCYKGRPRYDILNGVDCRGLRM